MIRVHHWDPTAFIEVGIIVVKKDHIKKIYISRHKGYHVLASVNSRYLSPVVGIEVQREVLSVSA